MPDIVEIDSAQGLCKIASKEYLAIGFGTYRLTGDVCIQAIKEAITAGYRIFDTATLYENFKEIGQALKREKREDVYVISKVWHDQQTPLRMEKDLEITLKKLQMEYIDAYFLHWPNSELPIKDSLAAMQRFKKEGRIHHIGLSNVTVNHLKRALEYDVPISWVQVEMHPFFYDAPLLEFCELHKIAVQAWRPLNIGKVSEDLLLIQLGQKYKKTPCQIALRWILQKGCISLPSSKHKHHIQENREIFDFSLLEEEVRHISEQARVGSRYRILEERGFGFADEFDFSYEQCWPCK
jgi:diketogulonate reductase-like aldo/keto reductase